MLPLGDNLISRMIAVTLGAVCLFALLVAVVVLRPTRSEPGVSPFQLPLPDETVAIVQALEASPPQTRPLVVRALNDSITGVRLRPDFPPIPPGLNRKPELELRFAAYDRVLGGREIRVELKPRPRIALLGLTQDKAEPPVRLLVGLKTGEVLVIEHRAPRIVRAYVGQVTSVAAIGALILLIGLGAAVRQTTYPVRRLADAARRFSLGQSAPDLPSGGPREIRDLSAAFNDLQKRIRALTAERTRLLAAVAHDLRTYLTRLRLRADFITDAEQRLRAERDIADMSKLLDDTLVFTRHATSAAGPEEVCDAQHEVAALVEQRRELGEPIILTSDGAITAPATLACGKTVLHRMVNNLTDNAIRYGLCARLSVESSPQGVRINVEDDGPGAPEEALADLVRPFVRLDDSRGLETGGAGLGLAIVKGMAESCGGALVLANVPGAGLRATLAFPVAAKAHAAVA